MTIKIWRQGNTILVGGPGIRTGKAPEVMRELGARWHNKKFMKRWSMRMNVLSKLTAWLDRENLDYELGGGLR